MTENNVAEIENWQHFSLNQLSLLYGFSRDTIQKRIEEQGINPAGIKRTHKVYHGGEVARAVFQPFGKYHGSKNPDDMEPKDRKDWYQGESERLKIAQQLEQLVDVNDVRTTMADIVRPALQLLQILPDILERDFNVPIDAIMAIEKRIDALRNEWAEQLEEL